MIVRVLLFLVSTIVLLMVAGPVATALHAASPALVVGVITCAGTFLLTMAFVRWDGITLRNVGAAPGRQTIPRFLIGFTNGHGPSARKSRAASRARG